VIVTMPATPTFIEPRMRFEPLSALPPGRVLPVLGTEGAWYLIRFPDLQWESRVGYVHCSDVAPLAQR
jgi:hypothetical protein